MFIGVLTLELYIPGAESLKDRRMVVQSVLDRIRERFNVSAAQLDVEGLWQRASIGVAVISNEKPVVDRVLNHVRDFVERDSRCDVCECRVEIL